MLKQLIATGVFLVAMLGTIIPASAWQLDKEPSYSKAHENCIARAGAVDFKMAECDYEERDRQDKKLNAAYRELISRSNSTEKAALQKAERAWMTFRDSECDYRYKQIGGGTEGAGTDARITLSGCKLEMTARRAKDIVDYLAFEREYGSDD